MVGIIYHEKRKQHDKTKSENPSHFIKGIFYFVGGYYKLRGLDISNPRFFSSRKTNMVTDSEILNSQHRNYFNSEISARQSENGSQIPSTLAHFNRWV